MAPTDVDALLAELARRRPLFHSEADFQHALAWEIQTHLPGAQVRLETPIAGLSGRGALDILIRHAGRTVGYELKYLKLQLTHDHHGEIFRLPNTGANDLSRYDICKDILRLEHMVATAQIDEGFAIVITNDAKLWGEGARAGAIDDAFKLHPGRTLTGSLAWSAKAGPGTTKGRESTLCLNGAYPLHWQEYSHLDARNGLFRALTVHVTSGSPIAVQVTPDPTLAAPSRSEVIATRRTNTRRFFQGLTVPEVTLTFDEIEEFFGPLPASATTQSAWWYHVASHPDAVWEHEGYYATPHLPSRQVRFRRR